MKQMSRRVPEEIAAGSDEVEEAVKRLSRPQLLRLENYAKKRIRGLGRANEGRDHNDLMQEAITRTLTGQRHWNKSVTFVVHLFGVIQSISNHWGEQFDPESAQLESEITRTSPEGKDSFHLHDAPSTLPNAEHVLSAKQEIERIESLFAKDQKALDVIGGWRSEMTGPEIQEVLEISKTEYETIARKIRRNVQPLRAQTTEQNKNG